MFLQIILFIFYVRVNSLGFSDQPCTDNNIKQIYSHSTAQSVDDSTYGTSALWGEWTFNEDCSFVVYMKQLHVQYDWIYWGTGTQRTDKDISSGSGDYHTDLDPNNIYYNFYSEYHNYDNLIMNKQIADIKIYNGPNNENTYCDIKNDQFGYENVLQNDCPFFWLGEFRTYFIVRDIRFFQFRSFGVLDYWDVEKLGFYAIPFSEYVVSDTRPFLGGWMKILFDNFKNHIMEKLIHGTVTIDDSEFSKCSSCSITVTQYKTAMMNLVDDTYKHMIKG